MTIAIWIIAVCELIRIMQYTMQLLAIRRETSARDNAYSEFVKSLKMTDSQFVRRVLGEFERGDQE